VTTHVRTAAGTGDQSVDLRDPYPFFAQERRHTCLGLHLARLETRVALDCLLSRLSNVNLVADGDPHIHGQPFRSPTALPVTFDAKYRKS
jgi:hypothetical protein